MRYVGSSSDDPAHILEALKQHPKMVYVTSDEQAMYALYGDDIMLCFVHDFSDMDADDINLHLQNSIEKVQSEGRNE